MADPDFSVITLSDVQSLLSQLDLPTDVQLEDAFNFQPIAAAATSPVPALAVPQPQPQAHASTVVLAVAPRETAASLPQAAAAASAPAPVSLPATLATPVQMLQAPMQVPQVSAEPSHARPHHARSRHGHGPAAGARGGDAARPARSTSPAAYREKVFGSAPAPSHSISPVSRTASLPHVMTITLL